MITSFVASALVVATLLALAGLAAERVAIWYSVPRRWVWGAALVASALLPALAPVVGRVFPGMWPSPLPRVMTAPVRHPIVVTHAGGDATIGSLPGFAAPPAPLVVPVLWTFLSLVLLSNVGFAYVRLRRIRARASRTILEGVDVRVAPATGPAVVGFLHPAIIVPQWVVDAPRDERSGIVLHEREHVHAGDHWLLALGTLALIAMPWNIALWWQHRRLRLAVETDCDARVLALGVDRGTYGRALILAAERPGGMSLLAPAWRAHAAHLRARIGALAAPVPRARGMRAAGCIAATALLTAAACEATAPLAPVNDASAHAATPLAYAPATVEYTPEVIAMGDRIVVYEEYTHPMDLTRMQIDYMPDVRAASAATLAPGRILVQSESGTPALVRVDGSGPLRVVSNEIRRTDGSAVVEVLTPAEIEIPPDRDYVVRFEAVDRRVGIQAHAVGGRRFGFDAASAASSDGIAVCRSQRVATIQGVHRGAKLETVTCGGSK